MSQEPTSEDKRNTATYLALMGVLMVAAAMFGLLTIVIPGLLKIVLVLVTFVGIGVVQYVLWGWKLDRDRIPDDVPVASSRRSARREPAAPDELS